MRLRPGAGWFRLSPFGNPDELTATEKSTVQAIAGGTYFVENEVPAGAIDGVNAIFTTANAVSPTGSIHVFLNGTKMKGGGVDYTFSGTNTITFVTAPLAEELLIVSYRRQP